MKPSIQQWSIPPSSSPILFGNTWMPMPSAEYVLEIARNNIGSAYAELSRVSLPIAGIFQFKPVQTRGRKQMWKQSWKQMWKHMWKLMWKPSENMVKTMVEITCPMVKTVVETWWKPGGNHMPDGENCCENLVKTLWKSHRPWWKNGGNHCGFFVSTNIRGARGMIYIVILQVL